MLTGDLYKYKEGKHVDCVKEVLHADNVALLRKSKLARRTVDRLIEGGGNGAFQRSTLVAVYDCLKEGDHKFADRFSRRRNFIDEYYEAQEKLGRKKKTTKRGEIEQSVLHQRIVHATVSRIDFLRAGTFWDDASKSIEFYSVILAESLIGLTSNSYGESPMIISLEVKARELGENVKILLVDPHSKMFDSQVELLITMGVERYKKFTREFYMEKLGLLEERLLPLGAQIKYYSICPTVSFAIVDDSRARVEYLLPYKTDTMHPTLTFERGDGDAVLFDVFRWVFTKLWEDGERTIPARPFSGEDAP